MINNMAVYRDCWAYTHTYQCSGPAREEPYCQTLRDQGCTQSASTCTATLNNKQCDTYEHTYQCQSAPANVREVMDCGSQTFCLDGDCFDTPQPLNNDYAQAAASLGAISEAGQDFDIDTQQIFSGQDLRCGKAALGFANCCKLDGWGKSLDLKKCKSFEQKLALQRSADLCHFIGVNGQ